MTRFGRLPEMAALAATALCTGCAGLMFDSSRYAEIDNPVPRKSEAFFGPTVETERWACSPPAMPNSQATRDDFLSHWGEPQQRSIDGEKEIWRYGETNRWCGVWVFAVLPIPFLLPVCDTFDRIEFVNGVAVRSTSRRFTYTSFGVAIVPPYVLLTRAGEATEDKPLQGVGVSDPKPCAWPEPAPARQN